VSSLYSLLDPLIWGVSWIIAGFHKLFSQVFLPDSGWAWGLSIVFLTVLIRAALIPLFFKQMKSMLAMQRVQPEVKKLQDRYKKELERAKFDPARKREIQARQQREMMALYKEHGTNPFASCLPLLVQSPFFMSLYRMLYLVANGKSIGAMTAVLVTSANKAHIFGAPISAHFNTPAKQLIAVGSTTLNVQVVIIVMTVIYVVTQFITQRQMILKNSAPDNPMVQQQKMMMYVMPPLMALFCFIAPVGVLIYLLTTNFWTMGQQFYMLHNAPQPGSKAHEAKLARLAAKEAKKAAKGGEPIDAVPPQAGEKTASANGAKPVDGAKAKSAGAAKGKTGTAGNGAGTTQVEDARPRPQRNQPVRTTRSGRKK
jgi:YidC/Oxa1 family membrane protein insertase